MINYFIMKWVLFLFFCSRSIGLHKVYKQKKKFIDYIHSPEYFKTCVICDEEFQVGSLMYPFTNFLAL